VVPNGLPEHEHRGVQAVIRGSTDRELFQREGVFEDAAGLRLAEGFQLAAQFGVFTGKDLDGQESGVGGTRLADGERSDGNAGGHLNDRKQRVQTVQGMRLDRNSQDREGGIGGDHSGEMCRSSRAGNDDFETVLFGFLSELLHPDRGPMGGDDSAFVGNSEFLEGIGRVPHRFPVGLASHDDSDERFFDGFE